VAPHCGKKRTRIFPFARLPVPGSLHGKCDLGHVQGAAVGERGVGIVELKRGHLVLALADRLLHLVARLPDSVGVVLGVLGVLFGDNLRVGDEPGDSLGRATPL